MFYCGHLHFVRYIPCDRLKQLQQTQRNHNYTPEDCDDLYEEIEHNHPAYLCDECRAKRDRALMKKWKKEQREKRRGGGRGSGVLSCRLVLQDAMFR